MERSPFLVCDKQVHRGKAACLNISFVHYHVCQCKAGHATQILVPTFFAWVFGYQTPDGIAADPLLFKEIHRSFQYLF